MSLSALAEARPDAFKSVIEIPLVAGSYQQLPAGVTFLNQIIDTVYKDANGNVVNCASQPSKVDDEFLSKYGKWGNCISKDVPAAGSAVDPCAEYSADSYSYSKAEGNFFEVTPAAPVGTTASVKASVYKNPDKVELAAIDTFQVCDYANIIFARMMANVLMIDAADDSILKKHQLYNQEWLDFVRLNYRSASRIGSGYYLGKVGEGDPNVVRPLGT